VRRRLQAGDSIGVVCSWWRGDPLSMLPPPSGLQIHLLAYDQDLAGVVALEPGEIRRRQARGDRAYLARLHGTPVACGWSATRQGAIGELGLSFTLPPTDRYLWDFTTHPAWRGRGLYPHLLQAILARESAEAERFWIGYDRDNRASERGILKAGFRRAGSVHRLPDSSLVLVRSGPSQRSEAAARLLGVPLACPAGGAADAD
jgi:RimJ/RimL family protein N-acetyltransferase